MVAVEEQKLLKTKNYFRVKQIIGSWSGNKWRLAYSLKRLRNYRIRESWEIDEKMKNFYMRILYVRE